MYRTQVVFLTFLLLGARAAAQPIPDTLRRDSTDVHDSVERLLNNRNAEAQALEQTAERLARLVDHPLDINEASASDLSAVPAITSPLAHRIVQRRRDHGPYSQMEDLTTVEGVDSRRLEAVSPYLSITTSSRRNPDEPGLYPPLPSLTTVLDNLDLEVIQQVTRDLNLGRGFQKDTSQTTFQGSPEGLTTRIRLGYERQLQLAATFDKDPGEPVRWDPATRTYGFDHVAGNLTLRDWGRLETMVLGDFTTQYGQGAALWQGITLGKGRDPISPLLRSGRGIVPFQSTSENQFFRGSAATVALTSALSVSGFASRRHRDATIDTSAASHPARTLSTGGRHRTFSEIQRKGTFGTTTVGGAVEYRLSRYQVGFTTHRTWFDRPLRPPSNRPDKQFAVSGTNNGMTSMFGNVFLAPYTLFGEVARTSSGVYGGLIGAALDHEAGVQAMVLGRRFPPRFRGRHNSSVGESRSTQNEQGLYVGLRLPVAKRWRIGAYVDQYQFPWLRFNVPRPSSGLDTRLVVEYDPRPWLSTYVQLRAEREEVGDERTGANDRLLGGLMLEQRQSARWHTEYDFSEAFTTRTRFQLTRYSGPQQEASHGILLSQGFRFQPMESLRLDARLAFFDTEGFESRIYAYEHGLLYSFSVPVLFDRGRRSYLLAQYEPSPAFTVEAKYGVTWYPLRRNIGSGLHQKRGDRSHELRLQLRWQY